MEDIAIFSPDQLSIVSENADATVYVDLIKQALEAPLIYNFSDILRMPNIANKLQNSEYSNYYELLNIFAYGTYKDYLEKASSLPTLTFLQCKKLRQLTIITLANDYKCISYNKLLDQLEIKSVRELEDLIIEAIYGGIIQAKLDQHNQLIEIYFSIGRDTAVQHLNGLISFFEQWYENCSNLTSKISAEVENANFIKEEYIKYLQKYENEIATVRKSLMVLSQQEADDHIMTDMSTTSAKKIKSKIAMKPTHAGSPKVAK